MIARPGQPIIRQIVNALKTPVTMPDETVSDALLKNAEALIKGDATLEQARAEIDRVDREMATNVEGVFAAGDCTGAPLQVSKAVGEGHVAALSACAYLDARRSE